MISLAEETANVIAERILRKQRKSRGLGAPDMRAWNAQYAMRALKKLVSRRAEGLLLYRALPMAERFHACKARWRIADGANRSSKTISAAVEFSRAHCGCDPYNKYPLRDGRSLVVGISGAHLANTMFPKVFMPGAFRCIRDEHTKLLRSVRVDPNNPRQLDPYDAAYEEKWQESPPLVPERMITKGWRGISFEDTKTYEPRMVPFVTGWRSNWRTAASSAKPPQGDAYDQAWIDEHIENEGFFHQMSRGMIDRRGLGMWSATPERANLELITLRDRALAGDPLVKQFTFLLDDNPYMPQEAKVAFWLDLGTDQARRVHYYGEYAVIGRRVYAHLFQVTGPQTCDSFDAPDDYCLYVSVDPGRQYGGTVVGWIDPDEQYLYVSDAWITSHQDARGWADDLRNRLGGRRIEAIVFDQQMGKQHGPGSEWNTAQFYFNALKELDYEPRRHGPLEGFFPGSNDISAREEALLGMMRVREEMPFAGTCHLQIMRGRCADLIDQINLAQYDTKTGQKRVSVPGRDDLMHALEYLAAFNPGYFPPQVAENTGMSRRQKMLLNIQQELNQSPYAGVELF